MEVGKLEPRMTVSALATGSGVFGVVIKVKAVERVVAPPEGSVKLRETSRSTWLAPVSGEMTMVPLVKDRRPMEKGLPSRAPGSPNCMKGLAPVKVRLLEKSDTVKGVPQVKVLVPTPVTTPSDVITGLVKMPEDEPSISGGGEMCVAIKPVPGATMATTSAIRPPTKNL